MATEGTGVRATARGRVQGVGYRASVVERARELGVLGWVRNQDDGTVLVHAEGAQDAVVALLTFLHEGPPGAVVEGVEVVEAKVEGHEQFAVRGVAAGRFVVERRPGGGDGPEGGGAGQGDAYVLHLEVDGGHRSWRLGQPPSMVPAEKRFATPIDTPPAADAERWDAGPYEQGGRVAWPEAIERGHAVFVLRGEQLRGGFALQRTRGSGPRAGWLLIKRRDEHAAG